MKRWLAIDPGWGRGCTIDRKTKYVGGAIFHTFVLFTPSLWGEGEGEGGCSGLYIIIRVLFISLQINGNVGGGCRQDGCWRQVNLSTGEQRHTQDRTREKKQFTGCSSGLEPDRFCCIGFYYSHKHLLKSKKWKVCYTFLHYTILDEQCNLVCLYSFFSDHFLGSGEKRQTGWQTSPQS